MVLYFVFKFSKTLKIFPDEACRGREAFRQRKEYICTKRKKTAWNFQGRGKNHRSKENIRKGTLYELVLFGFYQVIDRDPLKDFKQGNNVFRFLFWKGHSDISVENGFQSGLFIFYPFPGEKCYNKIEWFRDQ